MLLILDKDLVYEGKNDYFLLIDRGGLKWPTSFVINLITIAYEIFQNLISDFEEEFLNCTNQKCVLEQLVFEKLTITSSIPVPKCTCVESCTIIITKKCLY